MQRGSEGAGGDRGRESARRQSRLERPERSELKDKSFLSLSLLSPPLFAYFFSTGRWKNARLGMDGTH